MNKIIDRERLLVLASILPIGIKLNKPGSFWDYSFAKVGSVSLYVGKPDETIYVFCDNDNLTINVSLEVMQDMFDIDNLHKRILKKRYNETTNQERFYLHRYYNLIEHPKEEPAS